MRMDRNLAWNILECMRLSGAREPAIEALRRFPERDWNDGSDWLRLTGIGLLFWKCLQDLGLETAIPAECAERLARNATQNRLRVDAMLDEFACINRVLEGGRIPYAALKGFTLVPEYFPDASLRTFTDYDYLIPLEFAQPAGRALQNAGYVPRAEREAYAETYFRPEQPSRLITDLDDMFSARLPREVELHWKLWSEENMGVPLALPGDLIERSRWREWEGLRFRVLSEEDALIYHLVHTFRHLLEGWCRLSALYEVGYFMTRRSDAAFWDLFRSRISGCRYLPQIAGVIFPLSVGLFGAVIPPEIKACTTGTLSPAMALWVERYGLDSALENFSADKFTLLLYREFVDDRNVWRAVRRRRVFLWKRPSRVNERATPGVSFVRSLWQRLNYVLGLLKFHVPASMRYGWELARWRRVRREAHTARRIPMKESF